MLACVDSIHFAELVHLHAWEDSKVNLGADVVHDLCTLLCGLAYTLTVEDHGTSRTPQRLVGSCCHHV